MLPYVRSALSLITSVVFIVGCGSHDAKPGDKPGDKPGMTAGTGGMSAPKPPGGGAAGAGGGKEPKMMMKPPGGTGTGGAGSIIVGIPQPGSPGTVFPGGGSAGPAPLGAGCTPASAHECPTASGVCSTSSTSHPTNTTSGSICFYGPATSTTTTTSSSPAATIEYLSETAGGQSYYRFRITFDPAFVDNTYGVNAIGWGTKGHTFKDLVGSDHAELSLFDSGPTLVSMFDLDYITANSTSSCLYGALGVSGGEGKMLLGDSKYILAATTSEDRNLNGCGYCKSSACGGDCTVDSPATDASYTPNAAAPNWDYRVIYEVWVDAAVFAGKGFGGASITFVHASPSKASSNTVTVTPKPCGGGCPDGYIALTSEGGVCVPTPKDGTCPAGSVAVLTSEGAACLPTPKDGTCPAGYTAVLVSEGAACLPTPPGGGCPAGYTATLTSEGAACLPTPTDGGCPAGFTNYLTSEGAACLPTPKDGSCPEGFTNYLMSEGATCVPSPTNGTCPKGYHVDPTSEGTRCI